MKFILFAVFTIIFLSISVSAEDTYAEGYNKDDKIVEQPRFRKLLPGEEVVLDPIIEKSNTATFESLSQPQDLADYFQVKKPEFVISLPKGWSEMPHETVTSFKENFGKTSTNQKSPLYPVSTSWTG